MNNEILGIGLALLSAVSYSVFNIFGRLGLQYVRTTTGTLISVVAGVVVMGTISLSLYAEEIASLPLRAFLWFPLMGFLQFSMGRFFMYFAMHHAGIGRAATLGATSPLFGTALSILFLGEVPTWMITLAIVVIVAGASLVAGEKASLEGDSHQVGQKARRDILVGSLAALASGLAYGSNNTISRHVVTHVAVPPVAAFFSLLFGAISLSTVAARHLPQDFRAPPRGLLLMVISGVAGSGGTAFLMSALRHAQVAVVSSVNGLVPLLSLFLAHLFLRRLERATPRLWVGSVLVVVGVLMLCWSVAGR